MNKQISSNLISDIIVHRSEVMQYHYLHLSSWQLFSDL